MIARGPRPDFLSPGRFLGARSPDSEFGEKARLCIIGAPLDVSASFRPGTMLAPSRIREASWALEEYSGDLDLDIRDIPLEDLGDLSLPAGDVGGALAAMEEACLDIVLRGSVPVVLGGEHLVTLPVVTAERKALGESLGVVYLDAHADLRDRYLGVRLSHATVARRLCEVIEPGALIQVGVRSWAREERDYARENGISLCPSLDEAAGFVREALGARPVHVTIDIDVLDPAFAPGVGSPEPGGPPTESLLRFVRQIGSLNVIGLDLVEVSPPYDPWGSTAFAAAKIIREAVLSIARVRR